MKVLFTTFMPVYAHSIILQIEETRRAVEDLGIHWDVHRSVSRKVISNFFPRFFFNLILRAEYYWGIWRKSKNYDKVLIRYVPADPFFLILVLLNKNKIISIHHTKELDEINSVPGAINKIKHLVEFFLGPMTLRSVYGVIGVTPEIALYQEKRSKKELIKFCWPNAAPTRSAVADQRSSVPTILFIASNLDQPWQGVDLLIQALLRCNEAILVHIIGKASEKLQRDLLSCDKVVYHGVKSPEEISHIAAQCHVGISALANFRRGLSQTCTLKVRDYLAMGLPIFVTNDELIPEDFLYCRHGKLSIENLLSYVKEIKSVSRNDVRTLSLSYISQTSILSKLSSQLNLMLT